MTTDNWTPPKRGFQPSTSGPVGRVSEEWMSTGKRYWDCTMGETPLHKRRKWQNWTVPYDGPPVTTGDVIRVEIDTASNVTIILNPTDPPRGFKPMDPDET